MKSLLTGLCVLGAWAATVGSASAGWDNVFQPTLFERWRHDRGRRIGAHAAGVGAAVAVEGALVVLGGCQRNHVVAVAQHEK